MADNHGIQVTAGSSGGASTFVGFSAGANATALVSPFNSALNMPFDTVLFDTDSGLDMANSQYVIPAGADGIWKFCFRAQINNNNSQNDTIFGIIINDGTTNALNVARTVSEYPNDYRGDVYECVTAQVAAGDTVRITFNTQVGSVTLAPGVVRNRFEGTFLGA